LAAPVRLPTLPSREMADTRMLSRVN
jgi:hypothetical protein